MRKKIERVAKATFATKRNKSTNLILAGAASAALAGITGTANAGLPVQPGDWILGNQTGTTSVVFVSHPGQSNQAVSQPSFTYTSGTTTASVSTVEELQFDNYGGTLHNAQGNILGVSFGTSSSNQITGANIYSMATDGGGGASLVYSSTGLVATQTGGTATRLGGISVSANNAYVAVQGYDDGLLHILSYSSASGTSASQSSASLTPLLTIAGATDATSTTGFGTGGTYEPTFSGNTNVVTLDRYGSLHESTITPANGSTPASGADAIVQTLNVYGTSTSSIFTDVLYDPLANLYFASYGHGYGSTLNNTLYVLDSSFNLLHTVDLSTSTAGTENMEALAMDSSGNLFFTTYSKNVTITAAQSPTGTQQTSSGVIVNELPLIGASVSNAEAAGQDSSVVYSGNVGGNGNGGGFGYGNTAPSYSGFDIASGTSRTSAARLLVWSAGGTSAANTSGTWDGTTSNWAYNGAAVTWSSSNPDNAVFGASSGTTPVTITVSGTQTAGSITFATSTANYTIAGGTISLVGDLSGNGLVVNQSVTFASSSTLNLQGGSETANVASGQTLEIDGLITSTAGTRLSLTGLGNVHLGNTGNTVAGVTLSGPTLTLDSDSELGASSGVFQLSSGTVQLTANIVSGRNVNFGGTGIVNTGSYNWTINGNIYGAGFTKTGSGSLILNTPENANPGFETGTLNLNGGSIAINAINSVNYTALGADTVFVNPTTTVKVLGTKFGGATLVLNGGTLLTSGVETYTGALSIERTAASAPTTAYLTTSASTDVESFSSAVAQYSVASPNEFVGDTNATINVTGPGREVLQSGGVGSDATFAGSWLVSGGILQVGPVVAATASTSAAVVGPLGEPLNALGFKSADGVSGDPDVPNAVTIATGGILAIAVDSPNTNPNITTAPANPTPSYLRNPITLSGGTIASTGKEVTYGTAAGDMEAEGTPDSTNVSGNMGGNFTVSAGTSYIDTYDPVSLDGAGRSVNLVGGTRTITTGTATYSGGQVITYTTNWNGNLVLNSGGTTGGSFNILRDGGTISVTPGATITVSSGSILNVGGMADSLTDGTHFVNIVNNSTALTGGFNVLANTHQVGTVTGTGSASVSTGATMSVSSIQQSALTVNGAAAVRQTSNAVTTLSTLGSLTLAGSSGAWTGSLDLSNNDLIIHGGNLNQTINQLKQGFNNGTWTGTGGITSSVAAAAVVSGSDVTALGVELNNDGTGNVLLSSFEGQTVSNTDVLIKYTYFGDADLSGTVNGSDYTLIDTGFNNQYTGWHNGDFNYDGVVNGNDYTLIDNAYNNQTLGPLASSAAPADLVATPSSQVAAVPEPASIGLVLGAAMLLPRRRRRR